MIIIGGVLNAQKIKFKSVFRGIVKDETKWLTQKSMAELFNVDRTVITKKHI